MGNKFEQKKTVILHFVKRTSYSYKFKFKIYDMSYEILKIKVTERHCKAFFLEKLKNIFLIHKKSFFTKKIKKIWK